MIASQLLAYATGVQQQQSLKQFKKRYTHKDYSNLLKIRAGLQEVHDICDPKFPQDKLVELLDKYEMMADQ
jgi:hypothetical protein